MLELDPIRVKAPLKAAIAPERAVGRDLQPIPTSGEGFQFTQPDARQHFRFPGRRQTGDDRQPEDRLPFADQLESWDRVFEEPH